MTRQFNQEPRDDSRPPSRNISSNRYQEDQSSRPARPRLNRATVDRGWENGTPRHHPDYRPRMNNGQAPDNNWRKKQEVGNSSYNGPTGNRTNGNRQSQSNNNPETRRFEPSSQSYSAPRKQPFDSKGYNPENRRFNNQQGNGPHSYNNRQASNNQGQPQGHGPNLRTQESSQRRFNDYGNGRPQPNREHANSYGNGHPQPNREHANSYGNGRPQRGPERNSNKGRGYTSFNERPLYGEQEQRVPNPRLQSRPGAFQRRQGGRMPQESQHSAPYREQFEGDYERFAYDTPAQAESAAKKPFQGNRYNHHGRPSMPYRNGHARKGPRLVQSKDAEFRASINEDAEELINRVYSSPREQSPVHEGAALLPETTTGNDSSEDLSQVFPNEQTKPSPAKKQTRRAINAGRTKKAEAAPSPSKGPRPSQRGYKWPAP